MKSAKGYQTVDDPSVFVRFGVKGEERTSFMAWTTTPWTLPSDIALAVKATERYATVEHEGERLIVAEALSRSFWGHATVVDTRMGAELQGMKYEPPFSFAEPEGIIPGR
ncbi:MAG: class I tRNA ligase family protein [Polyangiales bacterium]